MPQYRVLTKSFINGSIVEEGQTVEYDGEADLNLELIESDMPRPKARGKKDTVTAEVFRDQGGE